MRKAVWCLLLTCSAVYAQDASDNAASDSLKKRVLSMNLLNPPTPPIRPKQLVLAGPLTAPKVCAIPLLRIIPPGTLDTMRVIKPQGKALRGDTVQVPAPACDDGVFTNRK